MRIGCVRAHCVRLFFLGLNRKLSSCKHLTTVSVVQSAITEGYTATVHLYLISKRRLIFSINRRYHWPASFTAAVLVVAYDTYQTEPSTAVC